MDGFFFACGPPSVCGAIDGSHISLSQKLDKQVIIVPINYYYKYKSCNLIILQVICDMDNLFGTMLFGSRHNGIWGLV